MLYYTDISGTRCRIYKCSDGWTITDPTGRIRVYATMIDAMFAFTVFEPYTKEYEHKLGIERTRLIDEALRAEENEMAERKAEQERPLKESYAMRPLELN